MGRLPGTPQLPALPHTISRTNWLWGPFAQHSTVVFSFWRSFSISPPVAIGMKTCLGGRNPPGREWPPCSPTVLPGCPERLSPHPHIARGILWTVIIWFKAAKPRLEQEPTSFSYVYSWSPEHCGRSFLLCPKNQSYLSNISRAATLTRDVTRKFSPITTATTAM